MNDHSHPDCAKDQMRGGGDGGRDKIKTDIGHGPKTYLKNNDNHRVNPENIERKEITNLK